MSEFDNPASRLYELISRYQQRAASNTSTILDAWAFALQVSPAEVVRFLPNVEDLVQETRMACEHAQQAMFVDLPSYLDSLAPTINPVAYAMESTAANRVAPSELAIKGILDFSRWMHQYMPEPKVPEPEEVTGLIAELTGLMDAIAKSDIDPGVKHLILTNLNKVLEALEHLRIGGGDAVVLASLALIGVAGLAEEVSPEKHRAIADRVRDVAKKVCVVFAVVAPMGSNLIGWDQVWQSQFQLPAANIAQAQRPQRDQPPHRTDQAETRLGP